MPDTLITEALVAAIKLSPIVAVLVAVIIYLLKRQDRAEARFDTQVAAAAAQSKAEREACETRYNELAKRLREVEGARSLEHEKAMDTVGRLLTRLETESGQHRTQR